MLIAFHSMGTASCVLISPPFSYLYKSPSVAGKEVCRFVFLHVQNCNDDHLFDNLEMKSRVDLDLFFICLAIIIKKMDL